MRKLPMEGVTRVVMVFKPGTLNADGKSGREAECLQVLHTVVPMAA